MLPPQLVLSIPVEAFLGLLPRLKMCAENMWAPFHGQNKAEEEYRMRLVVKISISLKMCPNFMAWFGEVVAHLPRLKIQNIKPTEGGYHHLEGLWDWSIYNWFRTLLVLSTWVE